MLTFRSIASSSAGNLYLLSDGETAVMLDCGLPWKKVVEAVGYDQAWSLPILVTHEHRDHCRGILDSHCQNDIYLPAETAKALQLSDHRIRVIEQGKTYTVGSMRMVGFPLIHDVECYGYLLRGKDGDMAAYIIDTAYMPHRLPPLSLLAIGCNYIPEKLRAGAASGEIHERLAHRIITSHMSVDEVVNYISKMDKTLLYKIYLLHLSDRLSDEEAMKEAVRTAAPSAQVFVAPK